MKKTHRRLLASALSLALSLSFLPTATLASDTEAEATEIMLMSTTDIHGKVWYTDLLTDSSVTNSLLKVASAVDEIRAQYDNTILIDNGDLFQGTTVSTYNLLSQGGANNPMVLALRNIGYDAEVLGNHEFNYAWDTMLTTYAELEAPDDENGTTVPVLSANVYWRDGENEGENAFTPYLIKTFDVDGQEFRVGIVGFQNTDCDQFDVPANFGVADDGTGGVTLTPPGNETRDMAIEAEKYVTELRASYEDGGQACDFVVVSYHSGMGTDNVTGDLVIGENTENQIARMVAGNTGIDLVIAGHDHQTYSQVTTADAEGNAVPVINAGGSQLARALISVTYDEVEGFDIALEDQGNLALTSYENDEELMEIVQPAVDLATEYVNAQYGIASGDWDESTGYKLGQNDTIDLINRAEYWTLLENDIDVDIVTTTSIVSSNYVVSEGDISLKDIYRMYKYDNYIYAVEMTGAQLKDWMEGVAAYYSARVSDDSVSYSVSYNFVTALFYGLDFQYNLAKDTGSRVENLALSATGESIADDDVLVVALNNYIIGQDPFVSAMGKSASSTTDKTEIIADAIWASQDALGDENGLVTQMVANYVQYETETNGSVTPDASGWSLTYVDTPELAATLTLSESSIDVTAATSTFDLVLDSAYGVKAMFFTLEASGDMIVNAEGDFGVTDLGDGDYMLAYRQGFTGNLTGSDVLAATITVTGADGAEITISDVMVATSALQEAVTITTGTASSEASFATFYAYDLNNDGEVNFSDIACIVPFYGYTTDDMDLYDAKYDVAGEPGSIGSEDYLAIYAYFAS